MLKRTINKSTGAKTSNKKEAFVLANKGSIKSQRALHIAADLSWNFGEDVVVYDVRNNSPFVSYYIVASANNDRRLNALVATAKESLYDNYKEVDHTEGKNNSEWVLIDAKDFVVQLFTKKERERVDFDRLYRTVPHKIVVAKKEPEYRRRKKPVNPYQNID